MSAAGGAVRTARRWGVPVARGVLVAALVATVGGCGLLDEKDTTTSSSADTLAPLAATQKVTVGGRQVAARCAGSTGDPSVLLVSGYDTELSQSWDRVQPSIG